MPTPFPFMAQGGDRLLERYGYRTDVLTGDSGSEQRVQLRRNPVGGVEFSAIVEGQNAIRLNALLELRQPELWAVPLWPWATPLTEDIPGAGVTGVVCQTTGIPFRDAAGLGQYVMIWASPTQWVVTGLAAVAEGTGGPIVDEPHVGPPDLAFTGAIITLDHTGVSNVVVYNVTEAALMVEGTDWNPYDLAFGMIFAEFPGGGGNIHAGDDLLISYDYVQTEGLTVSPGISPEFAAGSTLVIPCRVARLDRSIAFPRWSIDAGQPRLAWTFESVDDAGDGFEPTPSAAPATYAGLELLTKIPDRDGATDDAIERGFDLLDGTLGARAVQTPTAAPARVQTFRWVCTTRAEVTALKEFVDRRRGRAVPFWAPSFQRDLILAALPTEPPADYEYFFYPEHNELDIYYAELFAASGYRRHLQFRTYAGATVQRKVIATPDETTVQLEAPLGIDRGTVALVSFLRLCRLEDDEVEIEWFGTESAAATLHFRELPNEAPL